MPLHMYGSSKNDVAALEYLISWALYTSARSFSFQRHSFKELWCGFGIYKDTHSFRSPQAPKVSLHCIADSCQPSHWADVLTTVSQANSFKALKKKVSVFLFCFVFNKTLSLRNLKIQLVQLFIMQIIKFRHF